MEETKKSAQKVEPKTEPANSESKSESYKTESSKPETIKSEPANPASSQPQVIEKTVVVEKKSGGCFKWFTIGCIAIILLTCCLFCGLLIVAPSALSGIAASTTKGKDENLVRVDDQQVEELKKSVDGKNKLRDQEIKKDDKQVSITFTEEEFAYLLVDSLELQDNPNEVGVDLKPNYMKLEFGLKALLDKAQKDGDISSGVNLDWGNDLYISMEMSTIENGSKINIDKVSTGNSLLDALIPSDLTVDLENELNRALEGEGVKLKKIEMEQDKVTFTYEQAMPVK